MIALMVVLVMVGFLGLVAAAIGLVFKLVFGLIGGLFGLFAGALGLLIGGAALLLIVPIVVISMLPLFLPVLLIAAVIWAFTHHSRQPVAVQTTSR
jgi:hypothetical protein